MLSASDLIIRALTRVLIFFNCVMFKVNNMKALQQ